MVELACARIDWDGRNAVLVSIVDMTERHLADRALRRENAELEQALAQVSSELATTQRDLAAFSEALSNNLQGPLHVTNGFSTLLAEKYDVVLDDAGRHYVSRIRASTQKLARLVSDLRALVRLPVLAKTLEQIDLVDICNRWVDEMRRHDKDRAVTVEVQAAVMLMADKALVTIALACLLDNAWKFTNRKEQAWIRARFLPSKTPNERVLEVSDNGEGFDAAYADKLFTPFQRLHSFAAFSGNGLGLAIVKKVAERHGGRVWAKTGSAGTSFYMAFPSGGQTSDDAIGPM